MATKPSSEKENNDPIKNKICILYFSQLKYFIFNYNKVISAFRI